MEPEDLLKKRIDNLVDQGHLTRREAERFLELDEQMRSADRKAMSAFHQGREYRFILERVLDGLVDVGEPHAQIKKNEFLAEIGTMGPGVFLTPWEMTLHYLDQQFGNFADVAKFYGS
jgi:hypothetical protein